jgi:hypothetical protein
MSDQFGFFPAAGADYKVGHEPELASRLDALAKATQRRLIGISGHRTPAHSVAVGGTANDPHTQALASDTGGAETISDAELRKFGLYRPMTTWQGRDERNHIQLAPGTQDQHLTFGQDPHGLGWHILEATPIGAVIHGDPAQAVQDVADPAGAAAGAAASAAGGTASDLAGGVVSAIWGAIGENAMRILLYLLLVAGGLALALGGVRKLARDGQEAPAT